VAVTVLACLSVVAVVQPAPARRDLFFDEMPLDGAVVTARRGADVVLDCRAIGTPIPTIHWLHRGRRLVQVRPSIRPAPSGVVTGVYRYMYPPKISP